MENTPHTNINIKVLYAVMKWCLSHSSWTAVFTTLEYIIRKFALRYFYDTTSLADGNSSSFCRTYTNARKHGDIN
ncbi:unnamed protein product [Absidia cylindrospora]